MLPTNGNEQNCNPISSNCIIWQGPDIPCINLCKGDTVSDVVDKLATELCTLLNLFKIENYDLSCLGDCPKVENVQQLIQLIITNLCALQDCCEETTPGAVERGIDTEVPVAACFYYVDPKGDTITTMKLVDYAQAAGNKICTIVQDIIVIKETLVQYNTRITALEDEPTPEPVIPEITPVCVLPKVPTPIDEVLSALEASYCEYVAALGTPNELYVGIGRQCAGLDADTRLGPAGGSMTSIPGWTTSVQNIGQTIGNLWLTVCDLRAAVKDIKENCCPSGCEDVAVDLSATLSGSTLALFFTGTIPSGFVECTGQTLVTVSDSDGASIQFNVNLATIINDVAGYDVDLTSTPLNTALDFTIVSNPCLRNDEIPAQCEKYVQYVLLNSMPCPSPVTITPTTISAASPAYSEIEYSFPHTGGALTYIVRLYDSLGTTLIMSQSTPVTGPDTVSGKFTPVDPSTTYKFQINMSAGGVINSCPFESVTTPDA